MDLKSRAKNLKQDIPTVFLCLKDSETPYIAKLVAALAVTYGLSPIDLIPDFIPVLGYIDDIIILPFLIAWSIRLIPDEVWQKNQELAKDMWVDKKWYYSLPIILFWIIILLLLINIVIN